MPLELYRDYTRENVKDVFAPEDGFTLGAGRWGATGIVQLPGRPGDFVFFVTLGKVEGDHAFDEGIDRAGVLRWQSQPNQNFSDKRVKRLISHDAETNVVYLFLRTAARENGSIRPYTYLGRLTAAGYDRERERPVHFKWQLLSWPIPSAELDRIGLVIEGNLEQDLEGTPYLEHAISLTEEAPPDAREVGETTRLFQARQRRRPSEHVSRAIGLAGELAVLANEQQALIAAGRFDLAGTVVHTSVVEGDGAGFDIQSWFLNEQRKFIEVKTTTGPKDTDFLISANEVAFAREHPNDYMLARVFDFNRQKGTAGFYWLDGPEAASLNLTAVTFRAGFGVRPPRDPDAND